MPLPESEQVKFTVTGALFHPAAFGAGTTLAVTTGAVLSMSRVIVVVLVLPAASLTVPESCWFAPSVDTSTGAGQVAIPPIPPRQVKLTTTLPLFHPALFGAGVWVAEIATGTTERAVTVDLILSNIPRNAADTCNRNWPAAVSSSGNWSVKIPSPALISPFRPSSCIRPTIANVWP